MDRFTAQYQALMSDFLGQHRAIAAQDAFTASFLQYMINLESRLNSISNPGEPPVFPPSHEAQQLMATYSELSRARYDKWTATTRRAEALGLLMSPNSRAATLQPGILRPGSTDLEQDSPEFGRGILPFGTTAALGMPRTTNAPPQSGGLAFAQGQQVQPPSLGNLYIPPLQPPHTSHLQHSPFQQTAQPPFYGQNVQQVSSVSDSPAGSSDITHESNGPATARPSNAGSDQSNGFANFGEIRLASQSQAVPPALPQQRQQQQQRQVPAYHIPNSATSASFSGNESYFPAPGSAPIRPSAAITPGAVMVSTLNTNFGNGGTASAVHRNSLEPPQPTPPSGVTSAGESDGNLTPGTADITAANTAKNRDPAFLAEGEDIANFAAALKGGQSSAAVRSALTAQPLLIRRATYIPGWSVPPRVLLVEDDAVCRNLTTKFLQIFGCTIEVACDGVEAVNKMQSGVYDIVSATAIHCQRWQADLRAVYDGRQHAQFGRRISDFTYSSI